MTGFISSVWSASTLASLASLEALVGSASGIDRLLSAVVAGLSPESKISSFLFRRAFLRRLWPAFSPVS
ncbi:hypothetical protein AXX17_AT4G17640 [Arabidopsis thaliana]|uniref:Secreted protein n=1 Tax=Arabidopsis thaliana TaxID=3702 RepID=A0A178UVD2_ARATH|nr:hypothetical protein AXX17_AT4G17640 [Arabidopsis thaliana]